MSQRIVIYGAGITGKTIFPKVKKMFGGGGLCFTDSNPALWGRTYMGAQIIRPDEMKKNDKIVLANYCGYETIPAKLRFMGFEDIDTSFLKDRYEQTLGVRNRFLSRFAETSCELNMYGSVAEGGVHEGTFAKKINALFPNRNLYLFDTFSGFDSRDIENEKGYTKERTGHLNAGITENDVISIMPHPDKVIIRKGYFPETTNGISDEFMFVNLDFDLYKPTLAGLEFFWPKMVKGGIILVHDYFGDPEADKDMVFQGVRDAVIEFSIKNDCAFVPIGDECSVAFVKGCRREF